MEYNDNDMNAEQFEEYCKMRIAFTTWYRDIKQTASDYVIARWGRDHKTMSIDVLKAYDAFKNGYGTVLDLRTCDFIKFIDVE